MGLFSALFGPSKPSQFEYYRLVGARTSVAIFRGWMVFFQDDSGRSAIKDTESNPALIADIKKVRREGKPISRTRFEATMPQDPEYMMMYQINKDMDI